MSPRALAVALAVTAAMTAPDAAATCCPFPVPDPGAQILSMGQANLVIREEGTIRLIPNIRVQGNSEDFALVVPTPSLPALAPVTGDLWLEAATLTAPLRRNRVGGMRCSSDPMVLDDGRIVDASEGGVIVLGQQTVGAFDATFIAASSADSLVAWLNDNGFLIAPEQAAIFRPLVTDGWVFTAMKLQDSVVMPQGGWNTNVDPVEFRYAVDEFEIPLAVLTINMGTWLPVVVYSVDDHRTTLPGFDTAYSNRITDGEYRAIAERHPTLAQFLAPGRVLTRLDRTFTDPGQMQNRIRLVPAPTNDEFRLIVDARGTVPMDVVLLAAPFLWFKLRRRRRGA